MGSGSGPIAYSSRHDDPAMNTDNAAALRAGAALSRLLPNLGKPRIEKARGGAIDISADRLPFLQVLRHGAGSYRLWLFRTRGKCNEDRRGMSSLVGPRRKEQMDRVANSVAESFQNSRRNRSGPTVGAWSEPLSCPARKLRISGIPRTSLHASGHGCQRRSTLRLVCGNDQATQC